MVTVVVQPVVVLFDINDTPEHSDDVAFLNQPIPVRVRLEAPGVSGPLSIQILATDGALIGSSAEDDVQMSDGDTIEIYVTPTQLSTATADTELEAFWTDNAPGVEVGKNEMNVVGINLGCWSPPSNPGKVFGTGTPGAMIAAGAYRIPPRAWTQIWIQVSGDLGDKNLYLTVLGQSELNGETAFWDNVSEEYVSGPLEFSKTDLKKIGDNLYFITWIHGTTTNDGDAIQTQPGHALQLVLAVLDKKELTVTDSNTIGQMSAPFSVAAVPVAVRMYDPFKGQGADTYPVIEPTYKIVYGARYFVEFTSDSGQSDDLDKILVLKQAKFPRARLFLSLFFAEQVAMRAL